MSEVPQQVRSYLSYCRVRENALKEGSVDLKSHEWFFPTELLPLAFFMKTEGKNTPITKPDDKGVENYVNTMLNIPDAPSRYDQDTYVPFVSFQKDDPQKGEKKLRRLNPQNMNFTCYGGENCFNFLVDEIANNIYDHSEFSQGFVMAQKYLIGHFIEICLLDNGRTIAGSYKDRLNLGYNGLEGIQEAIKGTSSKGQNERGTGIPNTIKLVIEGMRGSVLIISGDGLAHLEYDATPLFADLKSEYHKLSGTLVSIRFPIQKKTVDIYEFID